MPVEYVNDQILIKGDSKRKRVRAPIAFALLGFLLLISDSAIFNMVIGGGLMLLGLVYIVLLYFSKEVHRVFDSEGMKVREVKNGNILSFLDKSEIVNYEIEKEMSKDKLQNIVFKVFFKDKPHPAEFQLSIYAKSADAQTHLLEALESHFSKYYKIKSKHH